MCTHTPSQTHSPCTLTHKHTKPTDIHRCECRNRLLNCMIYCGYIILSMGCPLWKTIATVLHFEPILAMVQFRGYV